MGAKPINALDIICFPDHVLDADSLQKILQGGIDKLREGVLVVLGGYSVSDKELKYGLAVTGLFHPSQIKTNHSPQAGYVLVLTKPIGTGILSTTLKNGVLTETDIGDAIPRMLLINRLPAELLDKYQISACTDVTGFGSLGHP